MGAAPHNRHWTRQPSRRHLAAAVLMPVLVLALSGSARAERRFTFYGLAPAAAGQSLAQAELALGQPLMAEAGPKVKADANVQAKAEIKVQARAEPDVPAKADASPSAKAADPAASAGANGCHYRSVANQPGVRYALTGGVISRIETRDARYATASGVHVGDTVERARRAYGKRLALGPHPYFDQGRTLTVYSPNRRFALVMESNDQGHIITLRGGRLPEVTWLEGCS